MGIIFIARPNHIVGVLPALIGILILLDGGMRIQTAKDAKVLGYERWWLVMILGAADVARDYTSDCRNPESLACAQHGEGRA